MSNFFFQRLQFFARVFSAAPSAHNSSTPTSATGLSHAQSSNRATPSDGPPPGNAEYGEVASSNLRYFKAGESAENPTLAWATATEPHTAYFTIERSQDAKNWQAVQLAAATGAAGIETEYAIPAPLSGRQKAYFRLRQTHLDGSFSQSGVVEISVTTEAQKRFSVSHNPVHDHLHLELADTRPAALNLRCKKGSTVLQAAAHGASAVLDMKALPRGVYFLTVVQAGMEEILRVVKS